MGGVPSFIAIMYLLGDYSKLGLMVVYRGLKSYATGGARKA